ncbi:hypothetical protein ACIOEW_10885 [Streptomyces sp. NPDC087901]|uniref:hypothetical protein n=1 Tax=Streptomyces sp. NPDC087901 TaxID=3365818 RepID=UPI0038090BBC
MRPRLVRGIVAGWVVLAVAGWGVTQWLGEPAATAGPGPVSPPPSGAEPGPQPESGCAAAVRAAKSRMTPPPSPSAVALPPEHTSTGGRQSVVTAVACDYSVSD